MALALLFVYECNENCKCLLHMQWKKVRIDFQSCSSCCEPFFTVEIRSGSGLRFESIRWLWLVSFFYNHHYQPHHHSCIKYMYHIRFIHFVLTSSKFASFFIFFWEGLFSVFIWQLYCQIWNTQKTSKPATLDIYIICIHVMSCHMNTSQNTCMTYIIAKKENPQIQKGKIKWTEMNFHPANKLCSDTFQFPLILFYLRSRLRYKVYSFYITGLRRTRWRC